MAGWLPLSAAIRELQARLETTDLRDLAADVLRVADVASAVTRSGIAAGERFSVYQMLRAVAETLGIEDASEEDRRAVVRETLAELGAEIDLLAAAP